MKLTSPSDLKKESFVEEIISKIEAEFEKGNGGKWFDAQCDASVTIVGEYDKADRDTVVEQYVSAGWSRVTHKSSSENGERPGLTSFIFYK